MDIKTSIQSLYYIATKYHNSSGDTNKMAALKLLFFAEKYHMQQYARSITNDTFFAMKNGPVASAARDILGFDDINSNIDYQSKFIENSVSHSYKYTLDGIQLDMLSDTDIEALDFAIDTYGKMDQWELVEETHKYQEWKRYEILFSNEQTKRKLVNVKDFFTNTGKPDDPFMIIPTEIVELSKSFYFNG